MNECLSALCFHARSLSASVLLLLGHGLPLFYFDTTNQKIRQRVTPIPQFSPALQHGTAHAKAMLGHRTGGSTTPQAGAIRKHTCADDTPAPADNAGCSERYRAEC